MSVDTLKVKKEADGMLKLISEGAISKENHAKADELLKFLKEKMGGQCDTIKLHEGHIHTHSHEDTHQHVHGHVHEA